MVLTAWKFESIGLLILHVNKIFFQPTFFFIQKKITAHSEPAWNLVSKNPFFRSSKYVCILFSKQSISLLESLKSLSRAEPSAPPPAAAESAETSEALGGSILTFVKW
jgi:hypothetical protein